MRFNLTMLLCTIGLVSLVGCGQAPTSTASNTSEPSPISTTAASPATSPSTAAQDQYPELLDVVTKTQAAVEANDFAKAQDEFDQFEGVWSQVEDGIKEKSSESYDAIEGDMDQITSALRSSKADQATSSLQALSDHIKSIP
ncbi:MAG: hypothetical protein SFY66_05415 [Oculatellaceae cyanobacterium bins.114]|nr:hypothetical protein [Oculatellaceae cyanobacterium bins.114]